MDSVYFGKEKTVYVNPDKEKSENAVPVREYYFPDENSAKYRIIEFIRKFAIFFFLDLIIVVFLIPGLFFIYQEKYLYIKFINFSIPTVGLVLQTVCLISVLLYFVLLPIGRTKVFVKENGTFYFIKYRVRVQTHRLIRFSGEKTERWIHGRYASKIEHIDNLIDKNSFKIIKVLTDCKESEQIHESGSYFTGYNEKKTQDEDFKLPSSYFKYDPEQNYYSTGIFSGLLFWFLKCAIYALVAILLMNNGKTNYAIYSELLPDAIADDEAFLSSYGYERDTSYSYEPKSVRFYRVDNDTSASGIGLEYELSLDHEIYHDSMTITRQMNFEDDLSVIYDLVNGINGQNTLPDGILEKMILRYRDGEHNINDYISQKDHGIFIYLNETDLYDYKIMISVSNYSI